MISDHLSGTEGHLESDVLVHLEGVNRLKIGDEWKTSEIPKKSRIIIDGLDTPIM